MCHASGARHRVGRGHLDSGRAAQSIAHVAVAFRWGGFTSIRPVGLLGSGCARDVLAGLAHIRGCCRVGVWSSGQGETDCIDQGCVEAFCISSGIRGRAHCAAGENGLWPFEHQRVGLPSSEGFGQSCAGRSVCGWGGGTVGGEAPGVPSASCTCWSTRAWRY